MGELEQVDVKQPHQQEHDSIPRASGGATDHAHKPDPEVAQGQIDRILREGHSELLLPDLFAVLPEDRRAVFRDTRMNELSKVSGKLAIEIAQLLGADAQQTIKVAISGKPPATAKELHAYVAKLDGAALASITGDEFKKLKNALPGSLLTVIPSIAKYLQDLDQHAGFLRWFIETTPSPIAATLIAQHATQWMAETFDKESLWTEWVDHLRPLGVDAGTRLRILARNTKDKQIQAKLFALSPEPKDDDDGKAQQASHAGDVKQELAGTPTVQGLVEAAGAAGRVEGADSDKLLAQLKKLGATADDLLWLASTVRFEASTMLHALAAAPGVRAEHLTTYLFQRPQAFEALADDKLRSSVRKTASDLRMADLAVFARDDDTLHKVLVAPANDGLRNWYLDDASPKDRLWFIGHDPKTAPRATRFVEQRVGMDWVKDLTSANDEPQLRILAINLKGGPTEDFIRTVLLGDAKADPSASPRATHGAKEVDAEAYGGEDQRFEEALANRELGLVQLIADLTDKKQAELRKDPRMLQQIGASLQIPSQWARVAHLLNISFTDAVAASPAPSGPLLSYLRERPQSEELAALGDPQLVKDAATRVHPNLLLVFPSLTEAKHLAKALKQDRKLLGLLLEGSDPNQVASLISHDDVMDVAIGIVEKEWTDDLLAKLPRYKHMSKRGKQGFDKLTKNVDDEIDRAQYEAVKSGDSDHEGDAKLQGQQLHDADEQKTLVEKLQALGKQHTKRVKALDEEAKNNRHSDAKDKRADQVDASSVNVLALLDMHRSEVPALLTDRTLREHVDKINELTNVTPDVAMPWLSATDLLNMPNSLRWWLSYSDPLAIMGHLDTATHARTLIAGGLNAATGGAREWLERVPKGMALDESETRVLDQIMPLVSDETAMHMLFTARFGFPPPSQFNAKTGGELYRIMSRLPRGHIMQGRIESMDQHDLGGDTEGRWGRYSKEIEIDDSVAPGKDTEEYHDADDTEYLTKQDLMKRYGFDEARFKQLQDAKRIEFKLAPSAKGTIELYRLKETELDTFTQVVLHEVGHAVDEILGLRTDPVFGYAGWRVHDMHAGFDNWASEMGGWDEVSGADKKQIKEAVIDASKAGASVQELVAPDHPAVDTSKYSRVGLCKHLRAGKSFGYTEQVKHGDRVFVANGYYGELYSLKAEAAEVAPSAYALYAPAEYFAEAYVEYYRGVDGKPGSSSKKGGALASPVKSWFDSHVDKVRFDPRRFGRDETNLGEDVPKKS